MLPSASPNRMGLSELAALREERVYSGWSESILAASPNRERGREGGREGEGEGMWVINKSCLAKRILCKGVRYAGHSKIW